MIKSPTINALPDKPAVVGYERKLVSTRQVNLIDAIGKTIWQVVYEVVQPETRTTVIHNQFGDERTVDTKSAKSNVFIIYTDDTWCKLMC